MNINRRLVDYCKYAFLLLAGLGLVTVAAYILKQNTLASWLNPETITNLKNIPLLPSIYQSTKNLFLEVIFNPYFYLMVIPILGLEVIIPANRNQKILSVGMWQDLIWLMGDFFVKALILIPYFGLLKGFYSQFLSQFSFNLPVSLNLPAIVTFSLSILLVDFLSWFSHLIFHKVPFLWHFHAIHHSQKELNLFTDLRFHFGEAFIVYPLTILPLYLLLIPLPGGIYYLWFRIWYPRLYHANIKSNFGWLRYIFVTPQSHRIHHSLDVQHYDCNFGIIFSFWDYLFQTQHRKYNEYPTTGISDANFPITQQSHPGKLLKTYWQQTLYPFLRWR